MAMFHFIITSILLAFIPGPDNLYLLNLSIKEGKKTALFFLLGLCSGLIVHSFLALVGIGALIIANESLFFALKVFGSFYLLYLAYGLFKHSSLPKTEKTIHTTLKKHYFKGVLMNLSNPKVLLFFLAFLPQFIDPDKSYSLQVITLGAVFIIATFFVFAAFIVLGSLLTAFLQNKAVLKALHLLTALFLVFIALELVFTHSI